MYILDVDLPEAGTWGAEFTTAAPGAPTETIRMTFDVHDLADGRRSASRHRIEDADARRRRWRRDEDLDRPKPDPAFYTTSVADAIAKHEPFILIFATPKFCKSAQCGPTLDRFKPVAAANPDVTFINVEPYQLKVVDGQLQPVLDRNEPAPGADRRPNEWGLLRSRGSSRSTGTGRPEARSS